MVGNAICCRTKSSNRCWRVERWSAQQSRRVESRESKRADRRRSGTSALESRQRFSRPAPRGQPRHHGHGRTAGQLRQLAQGPAHPQRAVGAAASARGRSRFPPAASRRRSAGWPTSRSNSRLAISLHGATDEVRDEDHAGQPQVSRSRNSPPRLEYYQSQTRAHASRLNTS